MKTWLFVGEMKNLNSAQTNFSLQLDGYRSSGNKEIRKYFAAIFTGFESDRKNEE